MKAFSIQQPWASLICCGLKDVENRKWALKNLPLRVLIHAGAKRQPITEKNQFEWMCGLWVWAVENYKAMGILPLNYKDFPTSAVVGVATIAACEEGNESVWACRGPGAEYQWVMKDVQLFKEPVLGVKGSLGIFEIPEIDEHNLPEFAPIPAIERNGSALRVPLAREFFEEVKAGRYSEVELYLTNDNVRLFADYDTLEPLPTEIVTFVCGDEEITKKLTDYETGILTDENGESYECEDAVGHCFVEASVSMNF